MVRRAHHVFEQLALARLSPNGDVTPALHDAAIPAGVPPLGELLIAMQSESVEVSDAAWAACYQHYRQIVWTRVFHVVRGIPWLREPREVAEDVTSDVFLGLVHAVKQYREKGTAEQWLKQVAIRSALRTRERLTGEWNKQKRGSPPGDDSARGFARSRSFVSFDDQAAMTLAQLDAIEEEELIELERRVNALRMSADPQSRRWAEFIELYRQGYGYAEIGERMGLTEGTARNWLVAIRKHLAAAGSFRSSDA